MLWTPQCCCGDYNVCSFESDGTLRWAVRWSAIDGADAGGMDVFDQDNGYKTRNLSIHVLGTKLVAVGEKNGYVHVAALNTSDGSESLSLTDSEEAVGTKGVTRGKFSQVVGSSVLFAMRYGTSAQEMKRFAVDSSGNVSVHSTGVIADPDASPLSGFVSPSGVLVAHQATASGQEFVATDGTTVTGPTALAPNPAAFNSFFGWGSEKVYFQYTENGANPVTTSRFGNTPVTPDGVITSLSGSPVSTSWISGYTIHSMSDADSHHAWLLATTGSDAVRYYDSANKSSAWTAAFTSTDVSSVNAAHIGPDDVIYLVPGGTGAMKFTGVDSNGVVLNASSVISDGIYEAGSTRVFSDANEYANISWKTDNNDSNNVSRWREVSGEMDIQWEWKGAPRLCQTVDSGGNLYCANANGEAALRISELSQTP